MRHASVNMTIIHRLISAGFAVAALASASVPALAFTVWPDVDFEWYANVGRPAANTAGTLEVFPAPRAGYIWSPGHYERRAGGETWVAGHWIKDDFNDQVIARYAEPGIDVASGPMTLHDSHGDVIPTDPAAYPIDSSRR